MVDLPTAQNTEFASNQGEYRLAIRSPNSEINPGEDIILEIYTTGYGTIRGPKVVFYTPIDAVAHVSMAGWALGKHSVWGHGIDFLADYLRIAKDYELSSVVDRIRCPTLEGV